MVEQWQGINLQLFAEEKTEEPTPRRRQEIKKKGQAARSADLSAAVALLVSIIFLFIGKERFVANFESFFRFILKSVPEHLLNVHNLGYLFGQSTFFLLKLMAPIFLVAMTVGLVVNFAQVGFIFAMEPLRPKLQNLNPVEGFKRIFSKKALVELGKSVLKLVLVGAVAYYMVKKNFLELLFLVDMPVPQGFLNAAGLLYRIALGALAVFIPIAIGDYIFQRYEFRQRLRMTKQEVKEEFKQMEGDPLIKSKLREQRRQMAMHRMMQSVPEATVVVTNPVHLAVALKYDLEHGDSAPRVVAKGAGEIAERIKKKARENKVPVVENPQVARFLYQSVDLGQEIPAELYQAVAEILAMLYRMQGNRGKIE